MPRGSRIASLAARVGGRSWFRIFRRGERLSTWQVVHELPGRLRVRDPLLLGDRGLRDIPEVSRRDIAAQVATALRECRGVHNVTIGHRTGSVLVHFNPTLVGRDDLLALLDRPISTARGPLALWSPSAKEPRALA